MNILVSPLPRDVCIGDARFVVKTGYRTGIQVARVGDADLDARLVAGTILNLYFGQNVPEDTEAAFKAVLEFHRCGRPEPKRSSTARCLDWDHDAGTILADFRREYGIDLADPATRMHWWAFMAYFDNLSSESEIKRAMYYRTARPRGLKGDDAKRFTELKRAYALPPRTVHETASRDAELWGD